MDKAIRGRTRADIFKYDCHFGSVNMFGGKHCDVFDRIRCNKCSFYKTDDEFNSSRDKAIMKCRELGLCDSCKYLNDNSAFGKCKLSSEKT